MSGTESGGLSASKTMRQRYGEDYYKVIGARGGSRKVKKGFALNRTIASLAGMKGGRISRKPPRA